MSKIGRRPCTVGLQGAGEVISRGGRVLAESSESALLWKLPEQLTEQGLADKTLPSKAIDRDIDRLAQNPGIRLIPRKYKMRDI